MTDPAVHARLTAVHALLQQPTPPALEGQETIPLEDDDGPDVPLPATQPSLW